MLFRLLWDNMLLTHEKYPGVIGFSDWENMCMASILQTIVNDNHAVFADRVDSWQEAIALSCRPLVADGSVDESYAEQIVQAVEKYGPYVVFDHQVAMPHTQDDAQGVFKAGVAFLRLKEAVSFGCDEDGVEKKARLFFTLAASYPEEHLKSIQQLAGLFVNEELLEALKLAETCEDILEAEAIHGYEGY